jgi:hypothetical protein
MSQIDVDSKSKETFNIKDRKIMNRIIQGQRGKHMEFIWWIFTFLRPKIRHVSSFFFKELCMYVYLF